MRALWSFVTDFGDTAVTVPLALLMAVILLAAKERRLALGWTLAILGCAGAIAALKLILTACGQPLGGLGLSSPSGHTAMSTAVYGGFAAVIGVHAGRLARTALAVGAAALLLAIAWSRAILHSHSPIEVLVGLAVGMTALAAIRLAVARHPPQSLPIGWLAAVALAIVLLFHGERWPAEQVIRRLATWFVIVGPGCG